jgi:hypothetical protein
MITITQENTETYQKFKLPISLKSKITGNLGEFIIYQYLIPDQISNEVKFVIHWDALGNLYCGTPKNFSIPYQVIQLLRNFTFPIYNFTPFDLISYNCNPPEEIIKELRLPKELRLSHRYYTCEDVQCPILLRKLQGILETEKMWGQIEHLINEYNNRPRHYRDLSPEEKEKVMKLGIFMSPKKSSLSIDGQLQMQRLRQKWVSDPETFWARNEKIIPSILSDSNKFNLIIIDHQLKCEYLKSVQLIEVKAVTNKRTGIQIRESQISTLRYISSMNFEIKASYQVLVVDLTNFNQMEFKIYCLDNQKIIDACQNGKGLRKTYLKLIKNI